VATLWLLVSVMALAFATVSWLAGAKLHGGHAAAIGLVAAELSLVVAIATLFSAFTTPLLASRFSGGLFLAGHLSRDLRALGAQSTRPWCARRPRRSTACSGPAGLISIQAAWLRSRRVTRLPLARARPPGLAARRHDLRTQRLQIGGSADVKPDLTGELVVSRARVLGGIVGSFLNVRSTASRAASRPCDPPRTARVRAPGAPVGERALSYWLRGRRGLRVIPLRYPAVECATGVFSQRSSAARPHR
jgi:hypothetical protein